MLLTMYNIVKILLMVKANIIIFYDFLCRSTLNGNCMHSSMSLFSVGDNSLVDELQCLTQIELHLNSNYYGKHDVFQSIYLSQKDPKMTL